MVNKKKKLEDVTKLIDSEITKFENRILNWTKSYLGLFETKLQAGRGCLEKRNWSKKNLGALTERKQTKLLQQILNKDVVLNFVFGAGLQQQDRRLGSVATGNSGWEFKERKELGEKIKQLVQIARKEGEIDFVELKSQVK